MKFETPTIKVCILVSSYIPSETADHGLFKYQKSSKIRAVDRQN